MATVLLKFQMSDPGPSCASCLYVNFDSVFLKCNPEDNAIYPFPKRQILDSSKLKRFADDCFEFDKNGRKFSKWVVNTEGKGEIAPYKQFLLFPQYYFNLRIIHLTHSHTTSFRPFQPERVCRRLDLTKMLGISARG